MRTLVRNAAIAFGSLASVGAYADNGMSLGAKIAQQGTSKGDAPCMTCHGSGGAGVVTHKI